MYYLIGRAFQNQSVILKAFPGVFSCRGVTAAICNNNNIGGFPLSTNTSHGRREYCKWTPRPIQSRPESQILSKYSQSVNAIVPKRQSSSGDHVTLWTAERILSGVLVPLIPICFMMPSAPLEYLLAFTMTLHSHWGVEAIVVDYVRPSIFGETIPKLAVTLVYGLSAMTLGGLFYFIYSDVGIVQAIKLLWKIK